MGARYPGSLVVVFTASWGAPVPDLWLAGLEAGRERLYAQLAAVGDVRRGPVTESCRGCGKPDCACARPDHPGRGPRLLRTRAIRGRKAAGREAERYAEFATLGGQVTEVSGQVCEAGLVPVLPCAVEGGKGGSGRRSRRRRPPGQAGWPRKPPGCWAAPRGWCRPGP